MKMTLGINLSLEERVHVLRAFVHRYTGDNRPTWATEPRDNGKPYPLAFANDVEWLANTRFAVTKTGRLDKRARYCESNPTWPNNPELRKG